MNIALPAARDEDGIDCMTFHLEIDSDSVRETHSHPPLYAQQTDSVRQVLQQLKANNTGSAFVAL